MNKHTRWPWKWLSKALNQDLTNKPYVECSKEQLDSFNELLCFESLRNHFAAIAIPHYLANTTGRDAANAGMELEEMVAVQCYMLADAMMAERGNR